MLSPHLRSGFPNSLFPSHFPNKTRYKQTNYVISFRNFTLSHITSYLFGVWHYIIIFQLFNLLIFISSSTLIIVQRDATQSSLFIILQVHSTFWYFADRASQYIYLNINQLDALNFIMSLFHASTCFGHKCSSSGGQNCTIQSLVSSHL